jgi:nicotinamide mononucleotide transporter
MPLWEWLAVLFSLAYVILAAQGNKWCWPAAFFSTLIYTVIFYDVTLFMDSFLNIYYLIMAIYGWYCWQNQKLTYKSLKTNRDNVNTRKHTNEASPFVLKSWPWLIHFKIIMLLSVIALVIGFFMATYTRASFAYLDSITTVFAIFATYLVAQKVVENWLYWLVIDTISIYLYIEKDLQPTAFLFVLYLLIASYGYWSWLQTYKKQTNASNVLAIHAN